MNWIGNYNGPICKGGGFRCVRTVFQEMRKLNEDGVTTLSDNMTNIKSAVEAARNSDYVIAVISNEKDGGTEGMDRVRIGLTSLEVALLDGLLETKKPLILVLVNGGMIAIDEYATKIPAIIEAFMPGAHGSLAVAETIFGENNPGGKLPVTLYHSSYVDEVDFLDMSMTAGVGSKCYVIWCFKCCV